jgi:hypothetical protein
VDGLDGIYVRPDLFKRALLETLSLVDLAEEALVPGTVPGEPTRRL